MSGFGEGHTDGHLPDGMNASTEFGLVVRADGMIVDCSVAARILLGLAESGDVGLRVHDLVTEPEARVDDFLGRCSASLELATQALHLRHGAAGAENWCCSGTTLGQGEVLLIWRPADRPPGLGERLQAKLTALTAEVERRSRIEAEARFDSEAKSRFLAAASHDLRQPLHAMTLFTRALSRRVEGEEAVELVNQLGVALGSLQRMFDSLLDISKLDGGLVDVRANDIDISEFFEPLGIELEARAATLGLSGRTHPINASVRSDRALLERIVRNLINNSLKFTAQGGVLLAARRRGAHIMIEVIDTGIGMSRERLGEVFDEFERGRSTVRGQNDGLGLGLSIVRRLTRLLDIDLTVESWPGRGTRFRLLLPTGQRSVAALRRSAQDSAVFAEPKLTGCTMLVLDDEPQVAAAVTRELQDHGVTVVTVANGAALAALEPRHDIDAAIVDHDLGDMRGLDAVAAYQQRSGAGFPILIVTGSTEPEVLQGLQASGHPWITKPVDPDVLTALIAGMLARR